ncbi:TonB-dependent receptor plug domain-containing protein [Derxia gummosa]|uniref:TonB-dependent receptor plug domain-containing protein n=1 Tax=Derxia gummosa DSM 723 TaxID=1121388 RepID=A0A8B6X4R2_9BURK|nr:TonB-dependent receptor [Derxia gummosa]
MSRLQTLARRPRLRPVARALAALPLSLALPALAHAATAQVQDVVVTTGSRGGQIAITDSPSPIDVIDGEQLAQTGKASLREILGTLIPSFTAAAQPGGGTSASIRPTRIRGLSGDALLVLINGKRRHGTAVYNNFGTGSTPVDLDLIPISAIERIELLRDGAAAQYGSDAIAGVLNIILKRNDSGGTASVTAGRQEDSPGDLFQTAINHGFALGEDGGFASLSFDTRSQGPSYAAGDAQGSFYYPLLNGQPVPYGTPGATPDPRDATVDRLLQKGYGRSNRDRVLNFAWNAELPVATDLALYSFGTYSHRSIVDTRGTFRPNSVSSLPEVFPDGFAAQRLISEPDYQLTLGGKGLLAGWNWDLGSTYGRDAVRLGAQNTLNASLGPDSKTRFYLGSMRFQQWTNNLDVTRGFDLGLPNPVQLSWGAEHRWELWAEGAGEPDSWRDGGYVIPSGPRAGQRPPAGLQSFVGNRPGDASVVTRNVFAAYIDLGTKFTERWSGSVAGRAEHYDDSSGNTVAGKLATRYEVAPGFALRGTVNNGFRAPSLAQQAFSVTQQTSIRLPDGSTQNLLAQYLPASSDLARALGARPLKPEKSLNFSVGATWEPTKQARVTLDAYQILVDDLIVKGENLVDGPGSTLVRDRLASLGYSNLYAAQYNTNAADVKVHGIDLASELTTDHGAFGLVRWSALYSFNKLAVRRVKENPAELDFLGSGYVVFGRQARLTLTDATPRDKLVLGANWLVGDWSANLRLTRFGKYTEPGTTAALDRFFAARWITDAEASWRFARQLTATLGASNLFGIRPTRQPVSPTQTGLGSALPTLVDATYNYGSYSPFGLNGGFYYARLAYDF